MIMALIHLILAEIRYLRNRGSVMAIESFIWRLIKGEGRKGIPDGGL